jgi:hypothetical protein
LNAASYLKAGLEPGAKAAAEAIKVLMQKTVFMAAGVNART